MYGMISFSGSPEAGPFWRSILEGTKTQTIRQPRKDGRPHVKVGEATKLYWRVRTPKERKPIHLIGTAMVTDYFETTLLKLWDDEENAKRDGFVDLDEFRDWFVKDWKDMTHSPMLSEKSRELNKEFLRGELGGEILCVIKWEYPLLTRVAEIPILETNALDRFL